jgi:hypothetical protein
VGTGGPFPGVKRGRGAMLTTHLHVVPRSRIIRTYTPVSLGACMAVSGQIFFFLDFPIILDGQFFSLCIKAFEAVPMCAYELSPAVLGDDSGHNVIAQNV